MMDGVLERLLNANELSARSTGSLVELQRATEDRLATIQEHSATQTLILQRLADRLDAEGVTRADAVSAIKTHTETAIKMAFSQSEMWWRRAFMIATALILIGQFAQVGLRQWLDIVSRAH